VASYFGSPPTGKSTPLTLGGVFSKLSSLIFDFFCQSLEEGPYFRLVKKIGGSQSWISRYSNYNIFVKKIFWQLSGEVVPSPSRTSCKWLRHLVDDRRLKRSGKYRPDISRGRRDTGCQNGTSRKKVGNRTNGPLWHNLAVTRHRPPCSGL
jgi:hypothetical protein